MYQKKSLKVFLYSLLVTGMFFSGCGGGSEPSTNQGGNNPPDNNNSNNNPPITNKFKYRKISIAGSSITQGNIEQIGNNGDEGYLGEKSYVGNVEKYFRENIADTIGPDELSSANQVEDELMSYQGKIKVYNEGIELKGSLKASDEIAISYAGSNVKTVVSLKVDGKQYDDYTIPMGDYKPVKKTFDDTNAGFYKAFRETNPKAVKIWKLDDNKAHSFSLIVKQGELHLNFITNHMYYFQNAGVGGFEVSDLLRKTQQGTYSNSTVKDIIAFNPDLFILESGTNDAKTWATEIKLKADPNADAPSTNRWIVDDPIAFDVDGNNIVINHNVNVHKGDVVIMGEYNNDIQNMAIGIVASDSNSKRIKLSKVITYQNQQVHEGNSIPSDIVKKCRIKSIKTWEDRVKVVISDIKNSLNHSLTVGIGTSGVPNYYNPQSGKTEAQPPFTPRRLLGYREKAKILAQENGWFFIDFFQRILKVNPSVDDAHTWTYGDNTHPNEDGRVYFGEAVIKALNL